ncbi:hypothetical protein K4W78_08195 [Pseudomonas aeruginosa]|nr:hypothetical protein [Pseudomonas aeruginosa]MCD2853338.1 hypothetical protein [Pseudomonas aeruginosa]
MTNELTDVRCSCGDEYPADSYDAGFIAGSGMCQNCDAALPPKDICTCPSGDGSLRHPCPAHPAVEQAGGDERAAFEAWLAQAMSKKFEPEFDLAKYEDSSEYRYSPAAAYWKAWQARAALAQPSPASDLDPFNLAPHAEAFNEAPAEALKSDQAEAERPEAVAFVKLRDGKRWRLYWEDEFLSGDEIEALMTVAQHERIVKAWIERWKAYIELSAKIAAQRDAAQAEVEALRAELQSQRERNTELIFKLGSATNGWGRCEKERDAAQARCAELKAELAMANDAAAKGDAARHQCAGMEMEIKELRGAAEHWEAESRALQKLLDAALAKLAELEKQEPVAAVSEETFSANGTSDIITRNLPIGTTLYAAPVAQAQHSVPETTNEEANSFLRVADAGQFKDNAAAVRTAAMIIRGLLHRPAIMKSIIRHRIGLTPEYEGQWHADMYGEDGEVQHHAEADTPDEAVRAVVALAAAPGKEGV